MKLRVKIARIVMRNKLWVWERQPAIHIEATTKWIAAKMAAAKIHHTNVVDLIPNRHGDDGTAYLFRLHSQCYIVRANDKKSVQAYIRRTLRGRHPLSWIRAVSVGISKQTTPEPGSHTVSVDIGIELGWTCGHCDHINPESIEACQACNCPVSGPIAPQADLADFAWQCPTCHRKKNPGRFGEKNLLCWKCFGTFSSSQVITQDQTAPAG